MALNAPNEGEKRMLQLIVNNATPEDLYLTLFGNNMNPGENDNVSFYTEISGGGYANISLVGANWTVTGGNNSFATYAAQTFTFTGATTPNVAFGYMVKGKVSNTVMWAERFVDGPYSINAATDTVTVNPRLELEG